MKPLDMEEKYIEVKEIAGQCAARLEELSSVSESLRAHALLSDTIGILEGIADGRLYSGQQRIRDNLFEFAELIDLEKAELVGELRIPLREVILTCSNYGFSVQGTQIGRKQHLPRMG